MASDTGLFVQRIEEYCKYRVGDFKPQHMPADNAVLVTIAEKIRVYIEYDHQPARGSIYWDEGCQDQFSVARFTECLWDAQKLVHYAHGLSIGMGERK